LRGTAHDDLAVAHGRAVPAFTFDGLEPAQFNVAGRIRFAQYKLTTFSEGDQASMNEDGAAASDPSVDQVSAPVARETHLSWA
jgi:hypothetical protein